MAPSIDVLMNTRAAEASAKDLSKALDGVAESVDHAVQDTTSGGDRMERTFREMVDYAKRAEKAVADIGDGARTADRDVSDLGDSGGRSLQRLGDQGEQIGGELRQNLGETFSSFRGDLEDLPQIAQDTLGGLAGSGALGGIPGLAVTAAGAAGLGLIIGAFERINEENEKSQERIGEWASAYMDAGGQVLTASQTVASAQEIITDPERWKTAQKNAELWGVSVSTAVLAQAGHAASIDAVSGSLDEQKDAYQRLASGVTENYEERERELSRLGEATGAYEQLTNEMEQGRVRADVLNQSLVNVANTTAGATSTVDEFGDRVVTLPDGKTIYIDAQTGQATQNADAIEQKIYGIQDKTVSIKLNANLDTGSLDRAMQVAQDRAARGVTLAMRTNGGAVWQ